MSVTIIKLKRLKFILDGDKTKISVRFRGRDTNSDMGLNLLNKNRT